MTRRHGILNPVISEGAALEKLSELLEGVRLALKNHDSFAAQVSLGNAEELVAQMKRQVGRGVHANPAPAMSESAGLDVIMHNLKRAYSLAGYGEVKESVRGRDALSSELVSAMRTTSDLLAQVRRGVHVNPMLVTFNPPRGTPIIAQDVQGILYRHRDDGRYYYHGFGGVEPSLKSRGDTVTISGLADRTDVRAMVLDGGKAVLLRHAKGLPLAEDL